MMRIWDGTRPGVAKKALAYTNHHVLPEALEKWPAACLRYFFPAIWNYFMRSSRLLDEVRSRFPGDEGRVERVSLVEEGHERKIAWLTRHRRHT